MTLIIFGAVLFLVGAIGGLFNLSHGAQDMMRGMRDDVFDRGFDSSMDSFGRTFGRHAIFASLAIIGGVIVLIGVITLLVG